VTFQSRAIERTIRIVGQARFKKTFHPGWVCEADWGCELIGVRIMLWVPKVLN
jgi:hypothetical protein